MLKFCVIFTLALSARGASDIFKKGPTIKSFAVEMGYRDTTLADDEYGAQYRLASMENPWYKKKEDNPQFGYSVALALPYNSKPEFSGVGTQTVIVSAPGNPSLKFTDPGFVEYQNIKFGPEEPTKAGARKAKIIAPKKTDAGEAHQMFGSTVTVVPTYVGDGASEDYEAIFELYTGAPEGARCGTTDKIGAGDSKSFDNFGRVYNHMLKVNYATIGKKEDGKRGPLTDQKQFDVQFEEGADRFEITGACWFGETFDTSLDTPETEKDFEDQIDRADVEAGARITGYAQMNRNLLGFSSHLSKNGLYLMFGAPMFKQQSGYVRILYRDSMMDKFETFNPILDLKAFFLCPQERLELFYGYDKEYDKLHPLGAGKRNKVGFGSNVCDKDLSYGYSLTSMVIKDKDNDYKDVTILATGGPRASALHGEIKVFKPLNFKVSDSLKENFEYVKTITGTRLNSGFGTAILGVDLDGNGYDELLVGEPYRTDKISNTYNSGGLRIYEYDEKTKNFEFKYELSSPTPTENNMFGFKLVSVGDLDGDGAEDVLVSALAEKGKGKVYLFSGRAIYAKMNSENRNMKLEPMQEFEPPTDTVGTALFGFSIGESRVDLDGNGFNDLVIGDPSKDNQKAHVYYANTAIRLLQTDGIKQKMIYPKRAVHDDCPGEKIQEDYNFCQPLVVSLENKGVYRQPDEVLEKVWDYEAFWELKNEKFFPWVFDGKFDIDVSLEKEPDFAQFNILNHPQKVEIKEDTFKDGKRKNVTFFVFGKIDETYGAKMRLKGLTTLADQSQIKVKGMDKFDGDTYLAEEMPLDIQVIVAPRCDVTLAVEDKVDVILGNPVETLSIRADITAKDQDSCYLIDGVYKLVLGTDLVGFTSYTTEPSGIATCRKQAGEIFVMCKFHMKKKFTGTAKIKITLSAKELVQGKVQGDGLSFKHELTWGNSKGEDTPLLKENTAVNVIYNAVLEVVGTDGSVAENSDFHGDGNEIDYSFKVMNKGISKIEGLKIGVYVPLNKDVFEYPEMQGKNETIVGDRCKYNQCTKFTYEFAKLEGKKSNTVVVKVKFIDKTFWKGLVEDKNKEFTIGVDYKVEKSARYGSTSKANYYPVNKEGTLELGTKVSMEKAPFPWWIVVVTSIVSVAIVIIVIIVLYKANFFTKKDPNKLIEDDISDDEFADENNEMTAKPYSSSAA